MNKLIGILTLTGALALPAGATAATRFEGTVVAVNPSGRTFRLNDAERGTRRFRVTAATNFERIAGFAGLKAGQKRIEVTARRSGGRWIATRVERSAGGGGHGGGDD